MSHRTSLAGGDVAQEERMERHSHKRTGLNALLADAGVSGVSDDDWKGLTRRHDAERKAEIDTLKIPPAMDGQLMEAATKVIDAISVEDRELAYRQGAELGLRHRGLIDFLRALDRAQQYEFGKKLINPNTFEVLGAADFRHCDKRRPAAVTVAAHYDVASAEMEDRRLDISKKLYNARRFGCSPSALPAAAAEYREWNYAYSRGQSTQSKLLREFRTQPRATYVESMGQKGLDSLVHAIGKFDHATVEHHNDLSTARSREISSFREAEKAVEAHERAVSAVRIAVAEERANPNRVSANVRHQIYLESFNDPKASPVYREVLEEKGLVKNVHSAPAPVSITHFGAEEYKALKSSLDRGHSFAVSDSESFFRAAYYRSDKSKDGIEPEGSGSIYRQHARAGLLLLAEEYRRAKNCAALRALESLVPDGTFLISPIERRGIFKPPVEAQFEADYAENVERAQQWQESLERFISRQGNMPRSEVLKLAAQRLLNRFSHEEIRSMQQLAAATVHNSRHNELRAVLDTAVKTAFA